MMEKTMMMQEKEGVVLEIFNMDKWKKTIMTKNQKWRKKGKIFT